jgi:hypothetical protein
MASRTNSCRSSTPRPRVSGQLVDESSGVRCLHDKGGHCSGLRHVDRMAARNLCHGGAGPFRHHPLCRKRNYAVLAHEEVPARLGPPGRIGDDAAQCLDAPGHLGIGQELGFLTREIPGKRLRELVAVEEQEAVLGWEDRRNWGSGG